MCDVDVDSLRYYAVDPWVLGGRDVLLARTGYTGEDGFEIYTAPDDAAMLWTLLTDIGESHGLVPAGLSARDSLRLEAGMPLHGHELSTAIRPVEAGLGRVVVFDKPDGFVGEGALQALAVVGATRTLVGLVTDDRRAPRHGCDVLDGQDGRRIGEVTSGLPSPTLGHPIAMAYVDVRHGTPGTELVVDVRGRDVPVRVVPLPFYSRPR